MDVDQDIDIGLLISLVETKPVLWDTSMEECKSRNLVTSAWREVCCGLNEGFENLSDKEKFIITYLSLILQAFLLSKKWLTTVSILVIKALTVLLVRREFTYFLNVIFYVFKIKAVAFSYKVMKNTACFDSIRKQVCKKWKYVRDAWMKSQKKLLEQKTSGSGAKTAKKYIFNDQLSFLKKIENQRETRKFLSRAYRKQ
ncbi:uncharacterized protein [Macrobrachium rosenbergii]|uniref:uncharacterized protein n=1 Tax=Macrobrachium rosenbergii TaxID=79674 RepID=UPI0034D5F5D1